AAALHLRDERLHIERTYVAFEHDVGDARERTRRGMERDVGGAARAVERRLRIDGRLEIAVAIEHRLDRARAVVDGIEREHLAGANRDLALRRRAVASSD